jgi:hypothetical protein
VCVDDVDLLSFGDIDEGNINDDEDEDGVNDGAADRTSTVAHDTIDGELVALVARLRLHRGVDVYSCS